MDFDLQHRRDELLRDQHLRGDLYQATPSVGAAGLVIGALMLLILGIVFLGSPAGERTNVASQTEAPATLPPSSP